MNRGTTLFLFLLVAVLGGLVWWQTGREERGDFDFAERLFEGVDLDRVVAIRIDNLERSLNVTLERDARGSWLLTDPLAYPARPSVMKALLDIVRKGTVSLVPSADLEVASAGFDLPRAVFEVREELPGLPAGDPAGGDPAGSETEGSTASGAGMAKGTATTRTTRIEIGALDLDGSRVYVRVRGRVFRTLRNIDTLLQQSVNEYRDPRVFQIAPEDVVRIARLTNRTEEELAWSEREGQPLSGLASLQAHRQQFRWWIDHPVRGQADPAVVNLLVTHLALLRVDEFVDDAPELLATYGLQNPRYEIELESRQGLTQRLLVGVDGSRAYAKREDLPYVWAFEATNISRAYVPAEALLDHNLVRVLRGEVDRVEIDNGRERVIVERVVDRSRRVASSREQTDWTVRTEGTAAQPAQRERVEEILSQLEHLEVIEYLENASVQELFSGDESLGVWLQLREERQGGRMGKPFVTDGGAEARTFLRDGESEVCLVPAELADLLSAATLDGLASLQLFHTDEVRLRRLTLTHGGTERRYFRSIEGVWRYEDLDSTATELFDVLDALFFLRAEEHLGEVGSESRGSLVGPVGVEIIDVDGNVTALEIGPDGEGRIVADVGGRRSVLRDQDLHARLVAIFE